MNFIDVRIKIDKFTRSAVWATCGVAGKHECNFQWGDRKSLHNEASIIFNIPVVACNLNQWVSGGGEELSSGVVGSNPSGLG